MTLSIAESAVTLSRLFESTDSRKLKTQLWRSGLTVAISLLVGGGVFLFMVLGPELSEKSGAFASFLLFMCVGMFLVSLVAFVSPLLDVTVHSKLQAVLDEMKTCDDEDPYQALVAAHLAIVESSRQRLEAVLRKAQLKTDQKAKIEQEIAAAFDKDDPAALILVPSCVFHQLKEFPELADALSADTLRVGK